MRDNKYVANIPALPTANKTLPVPDEIKEEEEAKPKLATETSRSGSGGGMRTGIGYLIVLCRTMRLLIGSTNIRP